MGHRVFVLAAVGAVLLLPVGCATKQFVREEVQKVEAELSQEKERVGRVASQTEGVSVQVRQVETQVTEVRSLADVARSRAEQATSKAEQAPGTAGQALAKAEATDSRLSRLWASRNKRNLVETVTVSFGFDKSWPTGPRLPS